LFPADNMHFNVCHTKHTPLSGNNCKLFILYITLDGSPRSDEANQATTLYLYTRRNERLLWWSNRNER